MRDRPHQVAAPRLQLGLVAVLESRFDTAYTGSDLTAEHRVESTPKAELREARHGGLMSAGGAAERLLDAPRADTASLRGGDPETQSVSGQRAQGEQLLSFAPNRLRRNDHW